MKTDQQEHSGGKVTKVSNKPSKQNSNANLYDKGSNTPGSTAPMSPGGAAQSGYNKESM